MNRLGEHIMTLEELQKLRCKVYLGIWHNNGPCECEAKKKPELRELVCERCDGIYVVDIYKQIYEICDECRIILKELEDDESDSECEENIGLHQCENCECVYSVDLNKKICEICPECVKNHEKLCDIEPITFIY